MVAAAPPTTHNFLGNSSFDISRDFHLIDITMMYSCKITTSVDFSAILEVKIAATTAVTDLLCRGFEGN